MSKDMMPQRWDLVGEYDSYMSTIEEGDWVKAEDVEPLVAEITRLRARVEVLEGLLKPVAEAANEYDLYEDANLCVDWKMKLRVGYLRKARAALEAKP